MTLIPYLGVIALPGLLALAMVLPALRAMIWRITPFAPAPALALALLIQDLPVSAEGPWLIMGMTLGLDSTSRLFVIFTASLWIAAGAAARQWMKDDPRATGFGASFLMAMCGNLGLLMAQDALSFYAFFAVMSFASYGLVIHSRDARARFAAKLYIAFVVVGELALFAGLALAAAEAGSALLVDIRATALPDLAVALLIGGFGVKLGVMPLHFWLPAAHAAAPAPASAVLSGAMIKAGLFGMISALPLGIATYGDHGTVLMVAGMITMFGAVLLGAQRDNPKEVLAFSSVSQMGILALGLGAALHSPAAWPAVLPVLLFLATHHALAKAALFLGTGLWQVLTTPPGRMLCALVIAAPALVLAGLPFTSGAYGKEALKTAMGAASNIWLPWLLVALTWSGVATTLLLARFGVTLWTARPKPPPAATPEALAVPFLGLLAAALALPLMWPVLAADVAAPLAAAGAGALWPVALGVGGALAALVVAHAQAVGAEVFAAQLLAPGRALSRQIDRALAAKRRALARKARRLPAAIASRAQDWRLGQSAIAGLLVIVLGLALLAGQTSGGPDGTGADATDRPIPIPFALPDTGAGTASDTDAPPPAARPEPATAD